MRWAQEQRVAFIGERLATGAMLRRADICDKFGISTAQAAVDLRRFMEMNPGAIRYDKSRKGYVLDGWEPRTPTQTADEGWSDEIERHNVTISENIKLREALTNAMTLVNAFTGPDDAIANAVRAQAKSCGVE